MAVKSKENNYISKEDKESFNDLKENLEDLQRYIESISAFLPMPFCMVNPLHFILDVNKAFEDFTGYGQTEINGSDIEILFFEKQDIEALKSRITKEDKRITQEFTLLTKEKKKVPVSVSILARKDREGNFVGYFLALSDISKLKEFQGELEIRVKEKIQEIETRTKELEDSRKALLNILEDTEEAFRNAEEEKNKTLAIVTNFSDGLFVFNSQGRLSLVNPQSETFFEVRAKNIVGKTISELKEFPLLSFLGEMLGKDIKSVFRKQSKVKENFVLEVSSVPLITEDMKVGNLIVFHDVTREKMIEQLKTEFVSVAAHQLRTPISAIKWTLKMFLDGDIGNLTDEQKEFLEKTYLSNERMINLINDLLNITRIEEGKYLYKPISTNIEEVVFSTIDSYSESIKKKGVIFKFKKPARKLPKVIIDIEKIGLVVQNLLDNAIKYTPKGEEIIASLEKEEDSVKFSVEDTGIGVPKDQELRLFTKFFRGVNALREETEGSGLGLFISKNIVEAHGGRIWYERRKEKGSIFYFTIPINK